MDFTRHLLQEEWAHISALEGHPVVHQADLRIGGTDRRFDMELLSEATYPRKAYHQHTHDRDTHVYSYRGIDSSHNHRFDRPTRFVGRNHADFAPYDNGHDYRHHISRRREDRHERDTDYGRSIYGSDCDKSRKRDGSWRRCDSPVRVRDRQSSSWKRDQSPEHFLYHEHYDRQRIRSPRVNSQWKENCDRRNHEHSSVVPSSTVRVTGLSSKATKEDVYQILAKWGPICNVRILKEKESSTCRGFAFIDFPSVRAARTMMEEVGYDGLIDDGRELSFEYSFKKIKSKSRVLHEKLNSKRRRLRQLERDAVAARAQQQQQEEKEVGDEEEGEIDDRDVVEVEDRLGVDEETEVEDREAGEGEAEVDEDTEVEDREAGEGEAEVDEETEVEDREAGEEEAEAEAEVDEETEVEDRESGEGEAEVEELVQGEKQQTEVEDREEGEAEVEELVQGEGEEQLQQKQQRQLVEEVEIGEILHGPSSHGISASMSCEELEERMDCIKEDPYLKVVIEDIEIGGPDVMMRYLSDPDVLRKLGHAMGFTV